MKRGVRHRQPGLNPELKSGSKRTGTARESSLLAKTCAAFTIFELLMTIGIITVLLSLILPSVSSAREASRRLQCKNQLKQIGLALHSYHELNRSLPPGWQWESTRRSAYGWSVPLLPFLEERSVYEQINRNVPLEDPVNLTARSTSIPVFLCPSDITESTFMLFKEFEENASSVTMTPLVSLPTGNYLGVFGTIEPDDDIPVPLGDGTFLDSSPVRFSQLRRGLSNTIIVGERTMEKVPSTWLGVDFAGEDAVCRLVGSAITTPNCSVCDECEFSSRHAGGVNFLWGDGHVVMISNAIDPSIYQKLSRRISSY